MCLQLWITIFGIIWWAAEVLHQTAFKSNAPITNLHEKFLLVLGINLFTKNIQNEWNTHTNQEKERGGKSWEVKCQIIKIVA